MALITTTSQRLLERPVFGDPGYVTFDATSGFYVSVPDAPEFDITADIGVVAEVRRTETATDLRTIAAKWDAAGEISWLFGIQSNVLVWYWSPPGTPAGLLSAVGPAVDLTEFEHVAVTFDVDNGAAGRSVRFWLFDPVAGWVQVGTTVTTAGVTSIHAGTAPITIGDTFTTGAPFDGDIRDVAVRDEISPIDFGPGGNDHDVLRVNWWPVTHGSFDTLSGHTATINGGPVVTAATPNGVPVGVGNWHLVIEQLVGTGGVWGVGKWGTVANGGTGAKWGSLAWQGVHDDWRGMNWTRGADQPFGRPRNGEISLTLDARTITDGVRRYDPVSDYRRTRPGNIIRAGLVSPTDPRADGWIPLWCGLTDSWVLKTEQNADQYAEVTLIETLSSLSRTDDNALPGVVGGGETAQPRFERLLDAAAWKFGFTRRTSVDNGITLQSTDMAKPRLDECYLTADSTAYVLRSDRTGRALMTDSQNDSHATPTLLGEFSIDEFGRPTLGFRPLTEDLTSGVKRLVYDLDSLVIAQDPEHIVNDHRYARVGGTQQLVEHDVSIGRFGRSSRVRNDLISTLDGDVLDIAHADSRRESITSIRVDGLSVTATGKGEYYLLLAALDVTNEVIVTFTEVTVFMFGPVRSMTHTVTPLVGRLHWTSTFAIDTRTLSGFPPGSQLAPLIP